MVRKFQATANVRLRVESQNMGQPGGILLAGTHSNRESSSMKSKFRLCYFVALSMLVWPAALAFAQAPDTQSQEEHFARTFALAPAGTLVVENYKGSIHIEGTSDNQVVVNVEKTFEGSDADRKWWMASTRVNFENDPGKVRVRVEYPVIRCDSGCGENEHSDYSAAVELTIRVPRRTNLDLTGHKPDMKISGTEGDIRINSHKSPIEIVSTTGGISIETNKETVHLRDVTLRGPLKLNMEKGEAVIEAKSLGNEVNIETGKGSVVLRVPANTGFAVDYEGGRRSRFHSDLPITSDAGYRSSELRGTINGGGTRLRVRTEKGSISIETLR